MIGQFGGPTAQAGAHFRGAFREAVLQSFEERELRFQVVGELLAGDFWESLKFCFWCIAGNMPQINKELVAIFREFLDIL